MRLEPLESRNLLSNLPFGAQTADTGEFFLGSVLVTPVLMESDGSIDASTEDWTPALIAQTKQSIEEGLQWWVDALEAQGSVHSLEFQFDYTYTDNPVETGYEPISRISDDYLHWTDDFLDAAGVNLTGDARQDIWEFNHAQRLAHDTNWAFTIFVVNSTNDLDDSFDTNGSFQRAFAFPGGRFFVLPSGRPSSTVAHETGHMFWGLDEYPFSASYNRRRGYLDVQNLNAVDDNPAGSSFQQADSIMSHDQSLDNAWLNGVSPASTFAMVGWQDTDGDGIFDVLDVPHLLEGVGRFNPDTRTYHFEGSSTVQALLNQNPEGLASDITLNRLTGVEVRIDGGDWELAQTLDGYSADVSFSTEPLAAGDHTIEVRTIDQSTGVVSNVFEGTTAQSSATTVPGINGFVWRDVDEDGVRDAREPGLSNVKVELVDQNGDPLELQSSLDPDDYPSNFTLLNGVNPEVTLSAVGTGISDGSVFSRVGNASTGERVFGYAVQGSGTDNIWTSASRTMRMNFSTPVSAVSIDAIGVDGADIGRLEIFDSNNNLLGRYTTAELADGQIEQMVLTRGTADIAFAVARAHASSGIALDNLLIGPQTSVLSGSHGEYQFTGLVAGTYHVAVSPFPGWTATQPDPPQQTVVLGSSAVLDDIDFGGTIEASPWQNPFNQYDVNGDGVVAPNDILILINELNATGPRDLSDPPGSSTPPYLDVSGDGLLAPNDPLMVINRLNSGGSGEGEAENGGGGGSTGFGGGFPSPGTGEGESGSRNAGTLEKRGEMRSTGGPGALSGRVPVADVSGLLSLFSDFASSSDQDAIRPFQAESDDGDTSWFDLLADDLAGLPRINSRFYG